MIPLISSMCQGPLGVRQLPRFWWKVLLRRAKVLDPDYPDCSKALDSWLLEALGLDREATLDYLRTSMPSYLAFEAWVLAQRGGALDPYAVARYNNGIERRVHVDPGKIVETYEDIGWGYRQTQTSAVLLNCLQDWQLFHRRVLTGPQPASRVPQAPLISSIDRGPLDVCQLPRTWLKVVLRARGWLHPDYPDCGGGLDAGVLELLGLDQEATLQFLRQEQPDYLRFEAWVEPRAKLDQERLARWNRAIVERVHTAEAQARIAASVGLSATATPASAVVLNHLEDWHLAHQALVAGITG